MSISDLVGFLHMNTDWSRASRHDGLGDSESVQKGHREEWWSPCPVECLPVSEERGPEWGCGQR